MNFNNNEENKNKLPPRCSTCPKHCETCDRIKEQKPNKNGTQHQMDDTLCWCCEYACSTSNDCSWMTSLKPVPEWTVIKHGDSYKVIDCPMFKRDVNMIRDKTR